MVFYPNCRVIGDCPKCDNEVLEWGDSRSGQDKVCSGCGKNWTKDWEYKKSDRK